MTIGDIIGIIDLIAGCGFLVGIIFLLLDRKKRRGGEKK